MAEDTIPPRKNVHQLAEEAATRKVEAEPLIEINKEGLQAKLELVQQDQLFASLDNLENYSLQTKSHKLLPDRHANRDFFLADLFDYAMKDDGASMEAPFFTLSTKPDLTTWNWKNKDGDRTIEVYPSVKGRATQFDKDVLIYVVSQMTEALNRKREDAKNRTVRFVVHDYLISTNKPTGGNQYERLEVALDRLAGTRIKTNIRTGGTLVKQNFGIIDKWKIVERSPDDERMIALEVTISEWLYNAVQAHEVLTLHRDYFRLRKPLERRLYELVRKHCGQQANWKIGLELLREKCGSNSSLREFRRQVIAIKDAKTLPEYLLGFDKDADQVIFLNKKPRIWKQLPVQKNE